MKNSLAAIGNFLSRFAFPLLDAFSDAGGSDGGGQPDTSSSGGGGGDRGAGMGRADGRGGQGDRGAGNGGGNRGGNGGGRAQGQGNGGGQGGNGGNEPLQLRDDQQIRTPDGRVITYGAYQQELRTAMDGEYRGRYTKGYELLVNEAKRIDALARARQGQGNGGGQGATAPDLLAGVRDMPVVDGQTIAKLVETLQKNGLGPMAQVVQQLQNGFKQMQTQLQSATQRFGSQDEERATQEFDQRLDKTLGAIEVKGLEGRLDPKNPALRTFARNLFLSYVPSSWKAGEFEKQLSGELSAVVQALRDADKKAVFDGRQKLKEHFNPNRGQSRPSGEGRYKFETAREIAAKAAAAGMFGGQRT